MAKLYYRGSLKVTESAETFSDQLLLLLGVDFRRVVPFMKDLPTAYTPELSMDPAVGPGAAELQIFTSTVPTGIRHVDDEAVFMGQCIHLCIPRYTLMGDGRAFRRRRAPRLF